jgi:Tannase and feruloyl esterase
MRIAHCVVFVSALSVNAPAFAATCESLAALKLPATKITAAQVVAAGAFKPTPPPSAANLKLFESLPAFCRVQGVIQPSSDSHIEFEVWLPMSGWNGKYFGVGNGGLAGSIRYAGDLATLNDMGLQGALRLGYAVSSTDTGHEADGSDSKWALHHPEKIADYGYRAIHETADQSKSIIRAFYAAAPARSYFNSCSNGGRQALMEAQRYPADYDGVIAIAPVAHFTHLTDLYDWNLLATTIDPASYIPARKLPAIQAAVLAVCGADDRVKDGIIDDPTRCHFAPATLLCKGAESDGCLTQPQVGALEKIYAGPRNSSGKQVYPGFEPGGEAGWAQSITGSAPDKSSEFALVEGGGDAYLLHQDPAYNYRAFNIDRDVPLRDEKMGPLLNAIDPDLQAFKKRGGKLLLSHGWNDPVVPPMGTINYYQNVIAKMGSKSATDFVRLYMEPGMQHCGGGPGPNNFGQPMMAALQHWVEDGVAPGAIIATKYKAGGDPASGVVRTRPLCPYPQVARYKGTGSTDEAANFACKAP